MDKLLIIDNGVIKISNVFLSNVSGTVVHSGSYTLFGDSTINGTLNVDTIYAKKIVNGTPEASTGVGSWTGDKESDINGEGFQWTWGKTNNIQLIYRTGKRLWTNASIDLAEGSSYKIGDVPVISLSELGPTVTKSNLREVGPLNTLEVTDDASIGEFAFFNSTYGRLGLGTSDPSLAIDIVENNVNIVIGSPATNLATIGTASNHDVGIVTDNITRIHVKNDGEVIIGDEDGKNGVLRVNGSLYVDNLVSDTRVDRTSSLQFQATKSQAIYGLGLTWTGNGLARQFVMRDGPDRLWSTESIDINEDKSFYIGGQPVVTKTSLGPGVTKSSLTSVGILEKLTVVGNTDMHGTLTVTGGQLIADAITVNGLGIAKTGLSATTSVDITTDGSTVIYGDRNTIEIGVATNNRKPIKMFGPVSVNINNPDPTVQFSVAGDVKIADKRFTNGSSAPAQGSFELGDICWNSIPQKGSHIGWVCVAAGNPGVWAPFGAIV